MQTGIIKIALLSILIGASSIPFSFHINSSPIIVWLGNALGSLVSALVVIYFGDRMTTHDQKTKKSYRWVGKKVSIVFEEGRENKKIRGAREFINKRGLKLFSFLCPIFPGVLVSTAAVYLLDLDKETYKRWMTAGIFFASGAYVFGYWWLFIK